MYCTEEETRVKPDWLHTFAGKCPIRILHVVGGMSRGGIETGLMHVLRHIDRDRFQMDFLVHTTKPCAYDEEIRSFGSLIIPCPLDRRRPWVYAANFKQILREYGPYDIVHSHVHHFSGYVLRLAKQAGVPFRIAHSHNDTSSEAKAGWYRRWYRTLTEWWIARHATGSLGCSRKAAADLFGSQWESDPRCRILFYGIDVKPFHEFVDSLAIRAEFGIPADAFVIGHVGRFVEQKNHPFLIEIAAEVAKREPKMRLLLVGEGVLQPEIERQVEQMGLSDRVIFAGSRPDIPRLMRGAMDVFLLPSLFEGLPVVGIEAQAAGLPFILSDTITREVEIIKPLVKWLSLSQPASTWAEILLNHRDAAAAIAQSDALARVEISPFNIETSVKQLEKIYQAQLTGEVLV
jgi:glycosyltransferase involved in cell wall biosynthesis